MTSWIDVAGWTLVHFVWQGALIALVAALALRLLRSSRPQVRYVVACAALGVMLAAPMITALALTSAPRVPIADSIHVLRSPQGSVVGVALTTPWSAPRSTSGAAPSVTELRLPAPVNTESLFSLLVTFWMAGVAILLLRLTAGCWRIRQLQAIARLEEPSRWQSLAEQIAVRLGLRRRFSVVESARVVTPTVIGWLQPIVLLPIAAMAGLSPRQVEAILAHELAHIRRHDFVINFLQTLAETVLFYHPAVWWMSRRIRTEREHCCDDVAVAISGDATEYAAALAELATWSLSHPALAMAATHGPLVSRIRRLLRMPDSDRGPRRTTFAVAAVLTSVVVLGAVGTILRAQPILGEKEAFGPPQVNRLLGFNLFPGPVQLPGADPVGAAAWPVRVGGGERELLILGHTARAVIRMAYDIEGMPVVGGPRWMDEETFDLTIPADLAITGGLADSAQVQEALQQTLEGRLGLVTHRETRKFPAYALVLANANGRLGPSLKPSTIDCVASGSNPRPNRDAAEVGPVLHERFQSGRFCGFDDTFFGITAARVTMTEFAREFHRRHYPMQPDREVVDRTGLTGFYDLEVRFGFLPLAAIGHAHYQLGRLLQPFGIRSFSTALPEQLGLKLVDTTISRDVLVIDQINRP
ncbi:MAG TPA: M56 family metallopeptidase [Vicinamibacterales bacterium]|nr:M56 family metallopeptidase [Vicinamibacterales bacterium]